METVPKPGPLLEEAGMAGSARSKNDSGSTWTPHQNLNARGNGGAKQIREVHKLSLVKVYMFTSLSMS